VLKRRKIGLLTQLVLAGGLAFLYATTK